MPTNTPQQNAFVERCSDPGSIVLGSVAGSGKTYTLQQAAQTIKGTGRATSFSKATVTELGKKLPSTFPARTMHGDGFDALRNSIGKCTVDKSNNKVYEFIDSALKDTEEPWANGTAIKNLVSHAQTAGIVPEHNRFLTADIESNWEALADQYDLPFNSVIHQIARSALIHSTKTAFDQNIISFDDMLYLPLFYPIRLKQHKTIIVDEAQDLSPIQHALLRKQLRPGGRIIAAGDRNQAIYAFRGAMTDSYGALITQFEAEEMALTVSFRCPKSVVREAQRYVPHIESAPNAIEGDVIKHEELNIRSLPKTVLCRNNAPLIKLALRLLVAGVSAEVAGKDIGSGLISLTKRLASARNSDSMKTANFLAKVHRWADREIARKPKKRPTVLDKVSAFEALCEHHRTLGDIRYHLKQLYIDPDNKYRKPAEIHLTTIHKAKGREWPEVLFLDPHLIPAKWAEQDWELQQEKNLAYVGVTRAQQILHYCSSEGIYR